MCVYIYVYIHICIYIYIHIHIPGATRVPRHEKPRERIPKGEFARDRASAEPAADPSMFAWLGKLSKVSALVRGTT